MSHQASIHQTQQMSTAPPLGARYATAHPWPYPYPRGAFTKLAKKLEIHPSAVTRRARNEGTGSKRIDKALSSLRKRLEGRAA